MRRNYSIAHAALAVALVFCSPGIHAQALLRFAISATDLRTALEAYAAQTAHQLIYRADDARTKPPKACKASWRPSRPCSNYWRAPASQ